MLRANRRTTPHVTSWLFLSVALSVAILVSCGEDKSNFRVSYAPDYPHGGATLSFFGVFKDGRMNSDAWDQVGPKISSPFGEPKCEAVYGDQMSEALPELVTSVDDYARANGVTSDLLERFAPMAKGDTIVVIVVAGHPPQPIGEGQPSSGAVSSSPTMRGMGRGGRGAIPPRSQSSYASGDRSVFQLAASFYSVKLRRSVAEIDMTYSGQSVDEALRLFVARLTQEMPQSKCAGWKWDAPIEPARVREIAQ